MVKKITSKKWSMRLVSKGLGRLFSRGRNRGDRCELPKTVFTAAAEPTTRSKRRWVEATIKRLRPGRKAPQQRYVTRQREGRRWWFLLPFAGVVLVVLSFFAAGGPRMIDGMLSGVSLFKVRMVEVRGNHRTSKPHIEELSGVVRYHSSLLGLDRTAIARRVEQDAWVRRAKVRLIWPSTVEIDVEEHRPVALLNRESGGRPQLYYVDADGEPFLAVTPGQDVDYPVITGMDRLAEARTRMAVFKEVREFLRYTGYNNPNLPAQSVSELHITSTGEMVVYLVQHPFPIFFGRGQTREKCRRLVRVLGVLYREGKNDSLLSRVEYIRMDYLSDKVLVAQDESG